MSGTSRRGWGTASAIVLLTALFVALESIGRPALPDWTLGTAAWWPGAGVALAVLARGPRRWWPTVLGLAALTSFVGDLFSGLSVGASAYLIVPNLVEILLAAGVLAGWRRHQTLTVTTFASGVRILAAFVAGLVGAGLVAMGYYALAGGAFWPQLGGFQLAHCLVLLTFAPLLLLPDRRTLAQRLRDRRENVQWAAQLCESVGLAIVLYGVADAPRYGFVLFLPLLWGAVRLGPLRAMLSTLVTFAVVLGSARGVRGPNATMTSRADLLQLLSLLTMIAVAVLLMLFSAHAQRLARARSADRERALVESQILSRIGSWWWDPIARELHWSRQLYDLFGVEPGSFLPTDLSWYDRVHPDDRDRLEREMAAAAAHTGLWTAEYRLRRPDGQVLDIAMRGTVTRDEQGAVLDIRGTCQDVTESREGARQLTVTRDLYQGVLDAVTEQAIIGTDLNGEITVFNAGAEKMLGYRADEVLGRGVLMLHDRAQVRAMAGELGVAPPARALVAGVTPGHPQTRDWTLVTSGGRRLCATIAISELDVGGTVRGYLGVAMDVTAQVQAETLVRESEERFRLAFDSASVGMYMTTFDAERGGSVGGSVGVGVGVRVIQANTAMCEFVGRPPGRIIGRDPIEFCDEIRDAEAEARELVRAGGDLSKWRREIRFRHADGHELWGVLSCSIVATGSDTPYVIALVEDITARKQAEERLRHLALHDALTGLPNRVLLADRIQQALEVAGRAGTQLGLFYCDLDGFKQVNDSAGHPAGDELLVEAGARLSATVRPGDTVARLGGDEFALLCTDLSGADEITAIATRALATLRAPFPLSAGMFTISASIGACLSSPDITSAEEFLHRADTAMYGAKRAGKDRFSLSSDDERAQAERMTRLRPQLETALIGDELIMYGQPIVDLTTGTISGVETLIRWNHPERGILSPAQFLDVAENSPLIIPIGRRVLAESCRMAARWDRLLGRHAPDVHVNVSGRQLTTGRFAQDVLEVLADTNLSPRRLILELTETHMPLMADSLRADMIHLRELGVRLAIDDIGTGYSSLARITEMPIDVLKIDLQFIRGLGTDPSCEAVVRAVLAIGRTLGVEVVAEGVETADQERLLRDYGCRLVQGYRLARPQSEQDLTRTLVASAGVNRRRPVHVAARAPIPAHPERPGR